MRALLGWAAPAGERARLSILIFHRVLHAPDPLFPDEMHAARFDALCGLVRRWFNVLPLPEAQRRLQDGTLPARALAITFDDGYADNHDVALPILQRHGLPATCFVATGFLDGGCMWNDRVIEVVRQCSGDTLRLPDGIELDTAPLPMTDAAARRSAIDRLLTHLKHRPIDERLQAADALTTANGTRLPTTLMMRREQVQALHRAGFNIGGHTVDHPILATLLNAAAAHQINANKQTLEDMLQQQLTLFAYPNGRPDDDYGARDVALVRQAGYEAAVSTAWGAARRGDDAFQLPRFTPWDRHSLRFGLRIAQVARQPVRLCAAA